LEKIDCGFSADAKTRWPSESQTDAIDVASRIGDLAYPVLNQRLGDSRFYE
jgi:hypothetical protein